MSYITRNLKQKVTYWAPSTPDVFNKLTYSAPVAIKARWEDRTELFMDPVGNEVRSRARVYVDRDVSLKGYLFLGTSTGSDPTAIANAYEIRDFRKIPNLRGNRFERRALL